MHKEKADMIIYTTEDGLTKVETTFDGDTVWLSIDQMAELFQRDKGSIIFFVGLTLPRYRFSKPSASLDMNLR